ncbi:MAG: RNA-binding transcriptional accessory protein [Saprospiraceae bacterium]|nr:RNA-binding transcriptional accessory protein [Saprospiraceae bacterium]HPG09585.1 Tex family protein [Saprospiraceae bacterium]
MRPSITSYINAQTQLSTHRIDKVLELLTGGATIPFIARYRKEMTGSLDETEIGRVAELKKHYEEIIHRQDFILDTIRNQDKLTPELERTILQTMDPAILEDLYLPFKVKRKTRATKAKELGLEPLADALWKQTYEYVDRLVKPYIGGEVPDAEAALQGARDILAERISEDASLRGWLRDTFQRHAHIHSKLVKSKEEDAQKYRDYFEFSEKLATIPSHRLLAILRGEQEGFLRIHAEPDAERTQDQLNRRVCKNRSESAAQVGKAAEDAYKRLLQPSLENELKNVAKEKADTEAIQIFAQNLRALLLAAPLGERRVLAIDPGFRTGCKVALLDRDGTFLHHGTIYPHPPQSNSGEAFQAIRHWIDRYSMEAIAIGNGTAGRETLEWLHQSLDPSWRERIYLVSESGASIYSASEVAREEFPDLDLTVRGAISIGRRLKDPLAELIKIDPKSIGVGQYQHDVNQKALKDKLDREVEYCVNQVGINLNTASRQLLTYVSGLGPVIAENIVQYRMEHGAFRDKATLLKVAKLGPKAYEQCAGFLRIRDAANPLDNTGVHPERYELVRKMASDQHTDLHGLLHDGGKLKSIELAHYTTAEVGLPTLQDIVRELEKPGLDPRGEAAPPEFAAHIRSIDDLQPGMVLPGVVNNITQFGAFIDLGIKESGLVHLSQMADRYIKHPEEVVSLQQQVTVKILDIDHARKRISLTMKGL